MRTNNNRSLVTFQFRNATFVLFYSVHPNKVNGKVLLGDAIVSIDNVNAKRSVVIAADDIDTLVKYAINNLRKTLKERATDCAMREFFEKLGWRNDVCAWRKQSYLINDRGVELAG